MKKSVFVLAVIVFSAQLFAEHVDRTTAEQVAQRWMSAKLADASIVSMDAIVNGSDTACYVFHFQPSGFVLVSASDKAVPIVGYSTESRFAIDVASPISPYIDRIRAEIQHAENSAVSADSRINQAWQTLTTGDPGELLSLSKGANVAPLLTTRWGQDIPYNIFCPDSGCNRSATSNTYALTGCVATAMAMVMHYHQSPQTGSGSRNGIDFNVNYDWDNMPISLTATYPISQQEAVATLMRHAGAAVDMQYGCNASSATLASARGALIQYFKYSSALLLQARNNTPPATWHSLLKQNIGNSLPVIYGGSNPDGKSGHAFVLDGYEEGIDVTRYHINWGWSGGANGYFVIDSLTPVSGANFNADQAALFGITPSTSTSSPRLGASVTSWTAPLAGGTSSVIAVTNTASGNTTTINYTVSTSDTWITVNAASGSTPGTVRITASDNSTGTARAGAVTITATTAGVTGSPVVVAVTQPGSGGTEAILAASMASWAAPEIGGQSQVVSVYNAAPGNSTIIDYTISTNATWLQTSNSNGSTPGSFIITANDNTGGVARTGIITISTSTSGVSNPTFVISVTQAGSGGGSTDVLVVAPLTWAAPAAGGTSSAISISVDTKNIAYSVASNATWIIPSQTNGTTPGNITLTASANSTGTARTGTVTISVSDQSVTGSPVTFTVTQAGSTSQPVLSVSRTEWNAPNSGGESPTITVLNGNTQSSTAINYVITESIPWVSVSSINGTTPGTFKITAQENLSSITRSGVIEVKALTDGVLGSPWTITVTQGEQQSGSPELDASPKFWTAPSGGGTSPKITVSNISDGDSSKIIYSISDDADWLTPTRTTGSTPGELKLEAEANLTPSVRFAVVQITALVAGVKNSPVYINITQAPESTTPAMLGVSPAFIVMNSNGGTSVPIQIYNASTDDDSKFEFSIQEDIDWVVASEASGTTPATRTLSVATNYGDSARVTYLQINALDGGVLNSPYYLPVYQSASLPGTLVEVTMKSWLPGPGNVQSPPIYIFGTGGASGISYRVRSDVAWLSTTWTFGVTPGYFNIITATNNTGEARTGKIYVTDMEGGTPGIEHVILVEQQGFAGYPVMVVNLNSWDAPVRGGASPAIRVENGSIKNTDKIEYSIQADVDWISTSALTGITPDEFHATIDPNTSNASRIGYVTIRSLTDNVQQGTHTIAIRQPGLNSATLSCTSSLAQMSTPSSRPGNRFSLTFNLSKQIRANSGEDVDLSFLLHYDVFGFTPLTSESSTNTVYMESVSPGIKRIHIKGSSIPSGSIAKITFETLLGMTSEPEWSVANPVVSPGIAEVGLDSSCSGMVTILPRNGFTTRHDIGLANIHSVYPNPSAKKSLQEIVLDIQQPGMFDVKVYNAMGMETVQVYNGHLEPGRQILTFDPKDLHKGMYFIAVRSADGFVTKPLVIQE